MQNLLGSVSSTGSLFTSNLMLSAGRVTQGEGGHSAAQLMGCILIATVVTFVSGTGHVSVRN